MFTRLKTWLVRWSEHYQQRETKWLHEEGCRLKKEVLQLTNKEQISLSPEERRLLMEKAKGIDHQVLKEISQFDFQDLPYGTKLRVEESAGLLGCCVAFR